MLEPFLLNLTDQATRGAVSPKMISKLLPLNVASLGSMPSL